MKLKRILSLLLAGILLFSLSACRKPNEYFTSHIPLTDEEFYQAPMMIVRAEVLNLKKEFFTNPDEAIHNAHVTTYDISILEIFKGSSGVEFPFDAQVHLINGEGLTEKQYKKYENPFLLEVGKEYVLGLSFPEEPYLELGGYVIEMEQLWTFPLGEDGLYENLDRGANHKTFDLVTLKEKITEIYHYEPEKQPVVPRYTVDESIKDPAITQAQREHFFDLVQEWRIDAMTEFTPDKPMQLEFFKYYCAYFVTQEEKSLTDMGVNYTGAAIERIAKWFGTTYGLKDDELVFLKADELRDLPLAELIQYKEEKVDGKTLVTARCVQYDFPEYYYMDWSQVPQMESYAGHKRMILEGYVSSGYESYQVFDVSFYTEDGKTPTQFVSYNCYYPESFDKGFPLPDFIPGENAEPEKTEPVETTPEPAEPEVDPLPKATVVLDENPKLEKLADGVYCYGIQGFYPTLFGKRVDFKEYLKENPLLGENIVTQARRDAENKLCSKSYSTTIRDGVNGGSTTTDSETYDYPEYKIHKRYPSYNNYKEPEVYQKNIIYITPPDPDWKEISKQLLLMEVPAGTTILRTTSDGAVREPGEKIFYYGIWRFTPTIDGTQVDFKELLETDPQAVEKLLNQAKEDAKKEICTEAQHYDGGTTWYIYEDYRIVNFHASIPDLEHPNDQKYLEGLVIGPPEMEYKAIYDMLMHDLNSKL